MEISSFQWTCEACHKVIKNRKTVSRHKKLHGTRRKNLFNCSKCLKEFNRNDNFAIHQKNCLQIKYNKCSLCLKQFKLQWYLKKHLERQKQKINNLLILYKTKITQARNWVMNLYKWFH